MRALLVVNPKATSTNHRTRDVLMRALGAAMDLTVEETGYRGHAAMIAGTAHAKGFDAVAVLGGDGTINEAANGLLRGQPSAPASERPTLIVIPGGSANVFARALGLPNNPVEATGAALEALRDGRRRTIGLGEAVWDHDVSHGDAGAVPPTGPHGSRYFTFCAGLGYDAEVVRAVEGLRSAGCKATPALYVKTAINHYFLTDRRRPAMVLERPRQAPQSRIFIAIVSNTAPWTFAGSLPINPTPWAGFETGLDLLALRKMRLSTVISLVRQIIGERSGLPTGRHLVQAHDEEEFTLSASRPVAFQLDGDYLGERERVLFRSIPDALQVLV
ncbi:diacylglycerol/lipid kinase family protein [Microtetraspora malaysiensis]|uniref:diacylglycerol/lipid kinase family protein n=1 Tax=Microtetraspora malaysiensis TaxID=161358 RepID=UPI0008309820|nr:diacylglycerol kinase family protein [Microtetraspora malaysiensis]